MKRYRIELQGCDDSTIMEVGLTEEFFQFCVDLANLSKATSTYGCMPIMKIKEIKSDPDNGN